MNRRRGTPFTRGGYGRPGLPKAYKKTACYEGGGASRTWTISYQYLYATQIIRYVKVCLSCKAGYVHPCHPSIPRADPHPRVKSNSRIRVNWFGLPSKPLSRPLVAAYMHALVRYQAAGTRLVAPLKKLDNQQRETKNNEKPCDRARKAEADKMQLLLHHNHGLPRQVSWDACFPG